MNDPERRRVDDKPMQSTELIIYQLGELKTAVNKGFERMDSRLDGQDKRITSLERFRERIEERDRVAAREEGRVPGRAVALATAFASSLGAIIYLLVNGSPH